MEFLKKIVRSWKQIVVFIFIYSITWLWWAVVAGNGEWHQFLVDMFSDKRSIVLIVLVNLFYYLIPAFISYTVVTFLTRIENKQKKEK